MWSSKSASSRRQIPRELVFLLDANCEPDQVAVARKKILLYQICGNMDVSPLTKMDLVLFPRLLGLFERGDLANGRCIHGPLRQSKISAIYRIIRNIPDVCSFLSLDRKRRRKVEDDKKRSKSCEKRIQHFEMPTNHLEGIHRL